MNLFPLGTKERMRPMRRDDDIEPVVTKILNACFPSLSSSGPGPPGNINAILLGDFPVSLGRVFPFRNGSGHIEVITPRHIVDGQLLNESGHRGGHTLIRHNCTSNSVMTRND